MVSLNDSLRVKCDKYKNTYQNVGNNNSYKIEGVSSVAEQSSYCINSVSLLIYY